MAELFTRVDILAQIRGLKRHDTKDSMFLIFVATHGWTIADRGSLLEGDEDAYDSGRRRGRDPWDELLFTFYSNGKTLANVIVDTDGDGRVSVEESFAWAVGAQKAALPKVVAWGGGPCAQYMYDGIEGETFLPQQ
ncbi:MAG TPA: hypothetical protein PLB30_06735 [Thermoleophilia bacterium]|nr:hypothetical protein [Thermoleophilia bacterium]HQG03649.1 hypothetical protein [Thermoleophilia bacterium]HQG54363.1 hypothetical protein [Thermoleophilia bacterium]HQJ98226.1 hypothetical protein [Thermoleophilia bacterium]